MKTYFGVVILIKYSAEFVYLINGFQNHGITYIDEKLKFHPLWIMVKGHSLMDAFFHRDRLYKLYLDFGFRESLVLDEMVFNSTFASNLVDFSIIHHITDQKPQQKAIRNEELNSIDF